MADIKVRIELNENAESEKIGSVKTDNLTFANTSIEPNSAGVFNNMPTRDNTTKGINALTFGQELYFNENGMLDNVDNYGGGLDSENKKFEIVWGVVNPDNTYNVKITFENAETLKDIVIYGDKESNQFPTRAILDDTTEVFSDDYIWTLQFPNESDTHTIEFTHWNRANYNAVLTFIGVMLRYIEIDKKNGLKSLESLSQSTPRPEEIFYGVIPSTGSLEMVDVNGEIYDMIKGGIIEKSNINIDFIVNNSQIQSHYSNSSSYTNNKIFSCDLTDELNALEKINYSGYVLSEETTLYNILLSVMYYLGYENEDDIMQTMNGFIFDNEHNLIRIYDYLKKIKIKHPYLQSSNFRDVLDKICTLAQLTIIKDKDKIKFISARPIISKNESIISIPSKCVQGIPEQDLITNNIYKSCFVPVAQISSRDTTVFTKQITAYRFSNYSTSFSNYSNIIGAKAYNPDITVLGNHIIAENVVTQKWYYSIFRYDYQIDESKLPQNYKFKWNDGWTYWIASNGQEITSEYNDTNVDVDLYDSNVSDVDIISGWVNIDNGNIVSVKTGAPNTAVKIRNNPNGSISLFAIILTDILDLDNKVLAIYNIHNFILAYENYNSSIIESNGLYDIELNGNELIQTDTVINDFNMAEFISKNIIDDYSNGISTAKLSSICLDMYDINGNLVKDYSRGEILQVGDIVRVDKDNNGNSRWNYADGSPMYWKITGRNFRYSGVPMLDLELQEVKMI